MSIAMLIPFVVIVSGGWLIPAFYTLVTIRRRELEGTTTLMWAALIVFAPILGVLAFWVVNPHSLMTTSGYKADAGSQRALMLFLMMAMVVVALVFPFLMVILLRIL